MTVAVDLYTSGQSWLHRADARFKLLLVTGSLVLLIIFRNVFVLLAAAVLIHLLHWTAATPRSRFVFVWRTLLPVSLLMLSLRVLFYPVGPPLFELAFVRFTAIGVAQGLVLALRIITMAFVVFAWLYTTDQSELVQSLVRLKLPYEWGLVLALTLRYIPTFQGTFKMISEAQQARGLVIAKQKGFGRVRAMMPIFVAMVITSLRASGQLAMALDARAFGVRDSGRTTLYELRFRPADYALTAVWLLVLAGLFYLRFAHGFGVDPIRLFA